jgi:Glycosyl hydrolases family 28
MHRKLLIIPALCIAFGASLLHADASPQAISTSFNIRTAGATGDGAHDDTVAINATIRACSRAGGGTIIVPGGKYLTGTIHMSSNCCLHLDAGAVLMGKPDRADYDPVETLTFKNAADQETSFFHHALIQCENITGASITGEGIIDANFSKRHGPKPIAAKNCKFFKVQGITIKNAPNYNISLLGCEHVNIYGVTILNGYADGIDPDSCSNVVISNCHIESRDDAIVLKSSFSLGYHRPCENVNVTNCFLGTECYCFKLGTESGSDFKQIAVSNCVMAGFPGGKPAAGGVALESVDGAHISGVTVSNLAMDGVRSPFYMRLGNRGRDMNPAKPGSLAHVAISNIVARNASLVCTLAGIPGSFIEDVRLSHMQIDFSGAGMLRKHTITVPENEADYPDDDMFGPLPSDGLYLRHLRNVHFDHIDITTPKSIFRVDTPDDRKVDWTTNPPKNTKPSVRSVMIYAQDISNVTFEAVPIWNTGDGEPPIVLDSCGEIQLLDCPAEVNLTEKTLFKETKREYMKVFARKMS